MKKFVIAAALIAAPTLTFAGGYGADLSQYSTTTETSVSSMDFITNFDPAVSATIRQPMVAAIGATVDTNMIQSGAVQTSTVNIQETVLITQNRQPLVVGGNPSGSVLLLDRQTLNSAELAQAKQDSARAKLLRYRSLSR